MTESSGIAYNSSPTRTSSAWMMANVKGNLIVKRVPCPGDVSTSKTPLRRLMLRLTTSMPTPRPDTSETTSAVENPGVKISSMISRSLKRSSAEISPCLIPRARTLSRLIPPPSSETSMMIWLPS